MSYCQVGDNPKVDFSFGGQPKETYVSRISPIDVEAKEFSIYGENYNGNGFTISVYSTNNSRWFVFPVRDYQIVDQGAFANPIERYQLFVRNCNSQSLVLQFSIDPATLTIDNSAGCLIVEPDTRRARLTIKNAANNAQIFQKEGDTPLIFNVYCGDCPEGWCKCASNLYPGYCCLNPEDIAYELRMARNDIRRIRGE